MELYKGNTFEAIFTITDGNSEYDFQKEDIVSLGIKYSIYDKEYVIYKEYNIEENCTSINLKLTHEETEKLPLANTSAVLEIELVYNSGQSIKTVYQENILLKGVVINE